MENKIETRIAIGKQSFTIWCNPGDDKDIDFRITLAIKVVAEEKADELAKQYVARAVAKGLEFLHKL